VISAGPAPGSTHTPPPGGMLLTSDLVLGYLENRPGKQGGIRAAFEPALPPEAATNAPPSAAPPAESP
jgi:hypothetical protein